MQPWKRRLICSIVMLASLAYGQTAQITGMVRDASGTLVPGAKIVVRNVATNVESPTVTNDQGYYTITSLNPGTYDISIQKPGFRTVNQTGVELNVAQVARMDFDLQIGEVRETITIAAEAPILTTERATIGQVIGSKRYSIFP